MAVLKGMFIDFNLVEVSAAKHDEIASYSQSVQHLFSFIFGVLLHKSKYTYEEFSELSTPIFKINTLLISRLATKDVDMFEYIVNENPFIGKRIEEIISLLKTIPNSTNKEIKNDFDEINNFFGEKGEDLYNRSEEIINTRINTENTVKK
jgi:prephenate dehydrogenase